MLNLKSFKNPYTLFPTYLPILPIVLPTSIYLFIQYIYNMKYYTAKKHSIFIPLFLCILAFSSPSSAQWTSKANALKKRSEVTSVVYNGKLYTFLGFSDSLLNVESSSEVYDPAINTWTLLSSLAANKTVTHQGIVLIDNKVWHIGGRVGSNPGPLTSEIWIYNISTNSWSPGPQIKDPVTGNALLWGGGGAALLGRTLHIFGGFMIDACNHDQENYHLTLNVDEWMANPTGPAPWKNDLKPLPIKRNHFSTIVLGGKIYALGGQFGHDCGGGQDRPYAHVYNKATNTWTELPQLPAPRSHAEGSTFAMDGKIYIVAGQTTSNANTNKVTIFNPAGNNGVGSWTDDTNLTLPYSYEGLSSKVIGSTFIFSHGGQGSSRKTRNTTYARTITRNPVYKLGFPSECAKLKAITGSIIKAKTLLFTIDGTKGYSISSNASWLTVSKNATGTAIPNAVDVEITANTTGLAPGNYSATITATGTGSGPTYSPAQYCINLTVLPRLEAEDAILSKAVFANNWAGYTGSGFADFVNNTGDYIEWNFNKAQAGKFTATFRYANGATTDRPLKLEVNGVVIASNLSFKPTGGWESWSTIKNTLQLVAGNNKIRLTAIGYSGPNIDHLALAEVPVTEGLLEAENAVLNTVIVASNHSGYTGTGFGDYINSSGDYIEWNLNNVQEGSASLSFRYANGATTNRPMKLEVNGVVVASSLSFTATGGWANWSTSSITTNLLAGNNKIRLTAIGYSGPNIDHLKWSSNAAAGATVLPSLERNMALTGIKITVNPNPASGTAHIYTNNLSALPVEITMVDVSGKVYGNLSVKNNGNGHLAIPVHHLPSGLYIVFVKQGNESASAKLVIENR
jgi:hypothetical protein